MGRGPVKFRFSIKADYFFVLALALLLLPFKWVFAWIAASVFHELCHYIALRISGCRTFYIQFSLKGAIIDTEILSNTKEMFCALSGPFGGLLLITIGKWCPRLGVCGFFQSVYNLIPIYPMDGGRAMRCVLDRYFSEPVNKKIQNWLEHSVLLLFLLLGLYAFFCLKIGLLPLFFAIILILKNKQGKYTCKESLFAVK